MMQSSYLGNKGQAAALDLAIFVSICILSLSYLFVESSGSSASTLDIAERENINEVAIKVITSLAQSSGVKLRLKTVQPLTLDSVDSSVSYDIRTLLGYAESSIEILDELERDVRNGEAIDLDSPHFLYIKLRADAITGYLTDAESLVDGMVRGWLDEAESNLATPCDAIARLSQLLPGYDDMDMSCSGLISDFLDDLVGDISNATNVSTRLGELLGQQLDSLNDSELADALQDLRCELIEIKDACNSMLTYLETGVDMGVSFLELWPVEANTEGMTIEKLLSDSMIIGDNFVFADDMRSIGGASGLLILRGENVTGNLSTQDNDDLEQVNGSKNQTEGVVMVPKTPLTEDTPTSSEGPYNDLTFGTETYITGSGKLGVRLKVWGDGVGGTKQKSNYFEGFDYLMNTSVYKDSTHSRKYNGSSVKGRVTEDFITITSRNWTEGKNLTKEITAISRFKEDRILRPMRARVNFSYGNLTWPEGSYEFDIEHYRLYQNSDYIINLSQQKCDDCNDSEALKSIILGIILTHRSGIKTKVAEVLEERLNELLEGYNYKFQVGDCCSTFLSINDDLEPVGTVGVAKYYFLGDNMRAEMNLTVWR